MIDSLSVWLDRLVSQNDVFAGVVGGSVVASSLYLFRSVPNRLWRLFLFRATCELEVFSDDDAFEWINEWLAHHPYAARCRRLKLSTFWGHGRHAPVAPGSDEEGQWSLAPGIGNHGFWHGGRFLWLQREIMEQKDSSGRVREKIALRVFSPKRAALRAIISEAETNRRGEAEIAVYTYANYWRRVARKMPRSLDTIVLPEGQIERIVADAEWFFGAQDWYAKRGLPYRRGYLLYGKPGCGKTSLVFALASHFQRPIYALNLGSLHSDESLFGALQDVPANAILLLEDVDAAHAARERMPAKRKPADGAPDEPLPITASALLNAIDGVASADGRLLVMTTNHPDRLDAALVRPGRVDISEEIGPLGPSDAARLFALFFPNRPEPAHTLAAMMQGARPAAELQGIFMRHSDEPWGAVDALVPARSAA